ncbi:ABC transporter permease [Marinimicrobium sp. C2-29]|uniref:ABC transporter permease n=1 Tax=Marinimicrobium sp. C2-29 TaxID=3139825 RepID=UPI003138C932
MRKILIIAQKEIIDNLRDKRSVFFALVYGAVLMPALMFGPLIYATQEQFSQGPETPVTIHVEGEERAPNLINHLHRNNIDAETAPENYREQLMDGELELVMEIAETYGENFTGGRPARVTLHYNREEGESQNLYWRVRGQLDGYSQTLAAQRMAIRGFDQGVLQPLDIVESELSKEDMGAGIIGNLLMFLVVLSMTMGGFYLAIDTTAGERERLSLEPLLSLPITRFQVTLGKYLAILAFVGVAFVTPVISASILIQFIPEQFFGSANSPSTFTLVKVLILNAPLCLLISGFLMAIAAYAKSIKEAQTQLGMAMLLPMVPFFVTQFMDVSLDETTRLIPVLSQYLFTNELIMDPGFALSNALPGTLASLVAAAGFFMIAVSLYRKDSILG